MESIRDHSDSDQEDNNEYTGFQLIPEDDGGADEMEDTEDTEIEYTDFTGHSNDFHSFDRDFNTYIDPSFNLPNTDISPSDFVPTSSGESDPFAEDPFKHLSDKGKATDAGKPKEYSKYNEKGHMVLEKDKLFPPEHAAIIQECMKNIKLDYKPSWSTSIKDEIWLSTIKNKLNNNNK